MMLKKVLFSLLLCSVCWPITHVVRYIDPDADGEGDGTSWEDAYTSAAAWDAAERLNLVTADQYHTVYARSSAGTADSPFSIYFTWVTDATHYVEFIQADPPGAGIYDETKYRVVGTDEADGCIWVRPNHCYVRNVQIKVVQTGANTARGVVFGTCPADNERVLDSCIIKGDMQGSAGQANGVSMWNDGDLNVKMYNCTIYGFKSGVVQSFSGVGLSWANEVYIYNCTIWDCYWGVILRAGEYASWMTNCIVGNCNTDFSGDITIDYCCSVGGSGTNAQTPLNADWDNEMCDANNGDFSLRNGGNCLDNGTDDPGSGLYSDDLIGDTRSSTWSIGAYEDAVCGALPSGGQVIFFSHWIRNEEKWLRDLSWL